MNYNGMIRSVLSLVCVMLALTAASPAFSSSYGRTPGHSSVNQGTAQYSINIWSPPGFHGVSPDLTLNYNSGAGDGVVGVGWSIGGLSAIYRCNRTWAQDGAPAAVTLTNTDAFCIDGNRLRPAPAASTTTFQTEIADFSQVTASGTAGNGPASFTVKRKNGLTYEYGATADSLITPGGGVTTAYQWALDKVTDRYGNYMTYAYTEVNGTYVISSINYTAASGSTSFPYSLTFAYAPRTAINAYIAGYSLEQAKQLSTITVTSGSTVVRVYSLGYLASPTTGRPALSTLTECADSALSNCLMATTISDQWGTVGISNPGTATGASTGAGPTNNVMYSADIDGDGRKDLIFSVGTSGTDQWWVQFATASGYSQAYNTGATALASSLLIDNFDGKNGNEILAPVGSTWYSYKWNSSSSQFVATATNIQYSTSLLYASVDVDGDGRPDVVSSTIATTSYLISTLSVYFNTSASGTVSFNTSPATTTSPAPVDVIIGDNKLSNSSVKRMDFDGDGRSDLLVYTPPLYAQGPSYVYSLLSRGSQPFVDNSGAAINGVIAALDFNGDGCTDLFVNYTLYASACNGSTPQVQAISGASGASNVLALDWNGDGRMDLLLFSSGTWYLYQSDGSQLNLFNGSTGLTGSNGSWVVTDQNADGLDDLVFSNASASNAMYFGTHNGANVKPDLAISFVDGYGVSFNPTYQTLVQDGYAPGTSGTYPDVDWSGPRYVVSKYTASDGIGGNYTVSYGYYTALRNLQGRGFEGFGQIHTSDSRNSILEVSYYSQIFPITGFFTSDATFQSSGGKQIRSTNYYTQSETLDGTVNNQRVYPYYNYITTKNFEVGGTEDGAPISTSFINYNSADAYGNFAKIETSKTDNDTNSPYYNLTWTSTVNSTFSPDSGTNWCLNQPTEVDTTNTAPSVPSITRHMTYSPDYTYCHETSQIVENGSTAYQVTTGYTYDHTYGNLTQKTVTGYGMAARNTIVGYDAAGQFPISVQNALTQTMSVSFDPLTGQQLSQTDPNGLETSWTYDAFARRNLELRPDGTSTTWAYNNCAATHCINGNNKMTVVQSLININSSVLTTKTSFLDWFDRVLVTSQPNVQGVADRNEVQYDNLGNVHQQAAPCTFNYCTYYWTVNTYDLLNRLTSSTRPISATNSQTQSTLYTYQGSTKTVTDAQGKVTTTFSKVSGFPGRTQDHNSYYVSFNTDAFGSVLSVTDSLSNTLQSATFGYGIGPFPKTMTDMDLGARTYTVDPLGEVTSYTDAKSQQFSMTYDLLSRPMARTDNVASPDLTTAWIWGTTAASHNIGQLQQLTSTSSVGTYTDAYTYDSAGRLSNRTLTLPGDGAHAFDYAYDTTTGLLSQLTYPVSTPGTTRVGARYLYNYGILAEIYDSGPTSTVWWKMNSANIRGQITQETSEDQAGDPQVVSNHAYDAVTGWLGSNQTGIGTGAALQNESYLYDLVGNVTERQNGNLGLTEDFYYDNLYRLDHSKLNGSTNLQMGYDATGNITSRSDIASGAAWTYDPTHKHQVTQAGSSSYTYQYDANGNASKHNGSLIGWTSYNYPSSVATSGESATFDYGPDRQRWRMIYTGTSGNEITYYATPLFEKVSNSSGTDYRHYIYANAKPVLVISRTSAGAVNTRSLLLDHQGSVSSIVADSTGTTYQNESFTAYGNRREASTWSGDPTSSERSAIDGVTREGYTFQTVLGSMGLNHMNGRVEDAVTGRFLSADRVVPDSRTQSFNRYSYVNNNPLTLIDPSGFDCVGGDGDECPDSSNPADNVPVGNIGEIFTGSLIPGVNFMEAFCYGNCASFNASYWGTSNTSATGANTSGATSAAGAGASGAASAAGDSTSSAAGGASPTINDGGTMPNDVGRSAAQSQLSGGTGYSLGCDAEGTICSDVSLNIIPYNPEASGATPHEAPPNMIQGPYNFQPFAQNATQISMGSALTQFAAAGIGGGAALVGGVAAAPLLRGPVLGAALNITSRIIFANTEVDEGAEIAIQTFEKLEAEFTSIELANPEVAGPEIPWMVH